MDTNKIEKHLLDRELKNIVSDLAKIGQDIQTVFARYGKIDGEHAKELHAYISSHVLRVVNGYHAGYTTRPDAYINSESIPDCVKELVLKWAIDDFFQKLDEIENICNEI